MKHRILRTFVVVGAAIAALSSCSKWTEPEAKDLETYRPTDEYYANLRAFKDTWKEREIGFSWYGGWTGIGADMKASLAGLPDSIDLIGIWGPWLPSTMTPERVADMEYVYNVKGTKVVATAISGWVGFNISPDREDYEAREELWGWKKEWNTPATWNSPDPDTRKLQVASIQKFARALADSVIMAGYHGFDIDHEPVNGGTGSKQELGVDKENFHVFVQELGKYFGPESGTDRLLVIDGNVHYMLPETAKYFDYFICQTYWSTSDSDLDSYLRSMINAVGSAMPKEEIATKYLVTCDFESNRDGGGTYSTAPSRLEGFAAWKPKYNGESLPRKGGCGGYHIEYEYYPSTVKEGYSAFYPTLRKALNIMNPPAM